MTKFLVTETEENILFRKIGKSNRGMAIANCRFYNVESNMCFTSDTSGDSIAYYDIDEQQPWGDGKWLDPDLSKLYMDSLKMREGKIKKNDDLNWNKISLVIIVVIIGFTFLSQLLGGELNI